MFGGMMTIPLYLQLVKGSTPTESGFQMLPMILGLMIASIASGQLMARTGSYKWFPRVGTAFMVLGFYVLTFLTSTSDITLAMLGMFLMGLGLGQLMQTLTVASQNSVGPRDIGVATSSSTFFRSMGGTAGTAILFSALFARIPETLTAAFANPTITAGVASAMKDPAVLADPKNAQILALYTNPSSMGTALNGDTSFLNNADPRLAEPFLVGFAQATVSIYWIGFFVLAVAFVLSWFLKATPLRQKSAMEEAADEDAVLLAERAADMMGAMIEPGTATGQIALAQAEEREAARQDHRDRDEAKTAAKAAKAAKPNK